MDGDTFCRPNDRRGFLHKKILGLGKKLLGVGTSLIPGPAGVVARTGLSFLGGGGGIQRPDLAPALPPGFRVQIPKAGVIGAVQRFLPGGSTGFTTLPQSLIPKGPGGIAGLFPGVPGGVTGFAGQAQTAAVNGCPTDEPRICPPRGFHLNKSSYFLRDGTFVPRGTKFVRNRRLNNANGRAQGKAIVRLEKGAENAKKLLKATGWRTISKQSSRELRMRRRGHR